MKLNDRVDIVIDGRPFTSYIWPEKLAKPVAPILSAPQRHNRHPRVPARAAARVSVSIHPHHAGLWFNYGNVNGFDFWNNSEAIKVEDALRWATFAIGRSRWQRAAPIKRSWKSTPTGSPAKQQLILKEHTRFVFRGGANFRSIDRVTRCKRSTKKSSSMTTRKACSHARRSRVGSPSDKPEVFTDPNGRATTVAKLDNTGVQWRLSNQRRQKRRCGLGARAAAGAISAASGRRGGHDHHSRPSRQSRFSHYWHARGYGLFAANPLARKSSPTVNKN